MSKLRIAFFFCASTVALILTGCSTAAQANRTYVFDGRSLDGWQEPHGKWTVVPAKDIALSKTNAHFFDTAAFDANTEAASGKLAMVNGKDGKTSNIRSKAEHGDCRAHIEFLVSSNSNSGVYFQGRYEVQILDSWGVAHPKYSDCGGIYQRWKDKAGYDGHAPLFNACKRPGQWQTFDVLFRAPRFDASGKKTENGRFVEVKLNGKVIHKNVEVTGPTRSPAFNQEGASGPLVFQGDHGPVAFRNVWIEPLTLP